MNDRARAPRAVEPDRAVDEAKTPAGRETKRRVAFVIEERAPAP